MTRLSRAGRELRREGRRVREEQSSTTREEAERGRLELGPSTKSWSGFKIPWLGAYFFAFLNVLCKCNYFTIFYQHLSWGGAGDFLW